MQAILVLSGESGIKALSLGRTVKSPGLAEGLCAGSRVLVINVQDDSLGEAATPQPAGFRLNRKTVRAR